MLQNQREMALLARWGTKGVHKLLCIKATGFTRPGLDLIVLMPAGKKVGVLESRVVAAGQTGRASGDVTYGNPTTYGKLESMYGADKARLVAQSQVAALAHVKQVTRKPDRCRVAQAVAGQLLHMCAASGQAWLVPQSW